MWRKIKSNLIFKKIYNYLDDKRKFILISYNKNTQRKLGLSLIDFRRFSGKYKVEEINEIKIFNSSNNRLLFEGQYSNRKKNGIGKEYNEEGELIFEGEYLENKRWKGKYYEYDEDNGKLILECEYLKGIIDGLAKEYDKYNGQLKFSGNYLNGKRHGHGTEYTSMILYKENEYVYDHCGYISNKYNYHNTIIFIGEFENGERKEGKEYNYNQYLIYEGGFLNGKKNGKGKLFDDYERLIYEGDYKNGIKTGKGKLYNLERL